MTRTPNGPYSVEDGRLLRHPSPTTRTTKGNVAQWIKTAIVKAYEAAGVDTTDLNFRAHEVRAVANSLAAYDGATLEEVMAGGRWRTPNSFFRHYLRDMSATLQHLSGPVIAAGRLVKH